MTNRELLEGAAKAAGIEYVSFHWTRGLCIPFKGMGFETYWNPLTNDGDALWLSVDLQIDLSHLFSGDQRIEAKTPCGVVMTEYCNTETRQEATRRAIVRAAYAIGVKL